MDLFPLLRTTGGNEHALLFGPYFGILRRLATRSDDLSEQKQQCPR
jgi:hypothetical protein